jgi:hypothetical protein
MNAHRPFGLRGRAGRNARPSMRARDARDHLERILGSQAFFDKRRLALGTLLLLAGLTPACEDPIPGVRIEFKVENEKFRPDWVRLHWLRPGRLPVEERLPENGSFGAGNDVVIGSLFVQTVGPLHEPRALAAMGFRGDKVVSGGLVRIPPSTGAQRLFQLILEAPLPDRDGNGVPDLVEDNCVFDQEAPCEGGASDAGSPANDADPVIPEAGAHDAAADALDSAAPPAEEGLVGLWRFDEGAGTRANDSSGNGNQGTLHGANLAWTAGRGSGTALEIPDENNHGITVNASPSIDRIHTGFTIAAWIYRTEDRGALATILSRRSSGSSEHFSVALTSDGKPRLYLNSHLIPAPPTLTGPDAIPMQTWVHLAATYNGTTMHLYANGTDIANVAFSTTIQATDTQLCIGCGQNADTGLTEPLAGRIDDLRLYDHALTAAEIAAIAR